MINAMAISNNFTSAVGPGYQTSLSVKVGEGLLRKDLSMLSKGGLLALTVVASIAFPPLGIGMLISTALGEGNLYTYLSEKIRGMLIESDKARVTLDVKEGVAIINKSIEAYKLVKTQMDSIHSEGSELEQELSKMLRDSPFRHMINHYLSFSEEYEHNKPLIDIARTFLSLTEIYDTYVSLYAAIDQQKLKVENKDELEGAIKRLGEQIGLNEEGIQYHLKKGHKYD
jgi:hypothetical protein